MIQGQTIFIDFDGTIIDASQRLYTLHLDIVNEAGFHTSYSKETYMALKRMKIPEAEIISFIAEPKKREFYLEQREKRIEEWKYLAQDTLFPWSKTALEQLRQHNTIILCTQRKNSALLFRQLLYLGIQDVFHDQIISFDKKAETIKQHPWFEKEKSLIVGDTEVDIETGKVLGIKTIAVASGMRNEEFLRKLKPDFVMKDISEVLFL